MPRTLAELAAESARIRVESEEIWKTVWKPKLEVTTTQDEFWKVIYLMLGDAGVQFTDELPALLSVNIIFEMDNLRQRTHGKS